MAEVIFIRNHQIKSRALKMGFLTLLLAPNGYIIRSTILQHVAM